MMIHDGRRGWLRTGATLALATLLASTAAHASGSTPTAARVSQSCPSAAVGGAAVGSIAVGNLVVPIKRSSMTMSGVLDAPPSARIASVVSDFRPLNATKGSSVLLWHSRFGTGCYGALNVLFKSRIGDEFTVSDASGDERTYSIAAKYVVRKGAYRAAWFSDNGPRQLTLVTCTDLRRGVFLKNLVIVAHPI